MAFIQKFVNFGRCIVNKHELLPVMARNNNLLPVFVHHYSENAFDSKTIDRLVSSNKVVLFMKGTPEAPKCGFSNAVVQILRMHGVAYDAYNVLEDENLRQGIKDYSNWPTIPQVFVNNEFIGGCDILLQMHQNGELIEELKKAGIVSALLDKAMEEDKKSKT